ncbi:hypothetical protein GCM10009609_14380 [Pseudonocardia aurantiaca]|uniref:Nucleotidyltransferase domain-containing protein n=1 Tax=Pseudonocardia aurantiaca TaxID=75290 RepID=A0ABW4FWP5_9PSEU
MDLADRLVEVPGVTGVMLGGSRARGDHMPESDVDLGVYHDGDLDVAALGALAREVAGPDASVTERGEWGPWVDGGGWLRIDGMPVDWIYRDLDRVRSCWQAARLGHYSFHAQIGHPLGVPDFAYPGEVALGIVLADRTGQLTALRAETQDYPTALAEALVAGLWEAEFLLTIARKAVPRRDATYVGGCLFRVVGPCCHAPARDGAPVGGQREGPSGVGRPAARGTEGVLRPGPRCACRPALRRAHARGCPGSRRRTRRGACPPVPRRRRPDPPPACRR